MREAVKDIIKESTIKFVPYYTYLSPPPTPTLFIVELYKPSL